MHCWKTDTCSSLSSAPALRQHSLHGRNIRNGPPLPHTFPTLLLTFLLHQRLTAGVCFSRIRRDARVGGGEGMQGWGCALHQSTVRIPKIAQNQYDWGDLFLEIQLSRVESRAFRKCRRTAWGWTGVLCGWLSPPSFSFPVKRAAN